MDTSITSSHTLDRKGQLSGTEFRSTQLVLTTKSELNYYHITDKPVTTLQSFGMGFATFQSSATPQAKPPPLIFLRIREMTDTQKLR